MSLISVLREATDALRDRSDTARLDAELLLAHSLGLSRNEMLLQQQDLSAPEGFGAFLARRLDGEPVAHILGIRDFWTISLAVTPDTLIPRPDSETLLEAAVAHFQGQPPERVLDLGTGSGALLLAALHQWPLAHGVGIDASAKALRIAQQNADALSMGDRAEFRLGDWTEGVEGPFDLLLINPPYIPVDVVLVGDVLREPKSALFAGQDGLDDYRQIIPELSRLLAVGGMAAIEIGYNQAESVSKLVMAHGMQAVVKKDLAGHDRCLVVTSPE